MLSTDDPIRVFEQLAIADAIAPGRIEAVAGRGSSTITFDLFDHDEGDYDMLFASKLDLLLAVNAGERVSFTTGATEAGRAPMTPAGREKDLEPGGMVFAGDPEEIAERIIQLHSLLGHDRQILQMDIGGMPHTDVLTSHGVPVRIRSPAANEGSGP